MTAVLQPASDDRAAPPARPGAAGGLPPGSRRGAVAAAVTLALVLVVLAGSIFYSLPSNVLSVRDGGRVRSLSARLLPQSWAFFTKPPNDPEVVPYRLAPDGGLEFASALPNSRSSNLFGLSRRQRAQGPEIAHMANQVTRWTDCGTVAGDCLATTAADADVQAVENPSTVATLCGRVLLVETEPVPWAFRHDYEGWRLDVRAALVEARCR